MIPQGFGGGAFALSAPTYISEVVDVSKRGAYTSFMQLQVSLGVAFVNALSIGSWLDWVTISRICSAVPGESPVHCKAKIRCHKNGVLRPNPKG